MLGAGDHQTARLSFLEVGGTYYLPCRLLCQQLGTSPSAERSLDGGHRLDMP